MHERCRWVNKAAATFLQHSKSCTYSFCRLNYWGHELQELFKLVTRCESSFSTRDSKRSTVASWGCTGYFRAWAENRRVSRIIIYCTDSPDTGGLVESEVQRATRVSCEGKVGICSKRTVETSGEASFSSAALSCKSRQALNIFRQARITLSKINA